MRTILMIILGMLPIFAVGQQPTSAQQQTALQCAKQFCDLLMRYSNGERTLNTQINALCSGADCSAFDDIKTNKEVTLRNYLMAIQQKYPQKLDMTISAPTLANAQFYVEPKMTMNPQWQSVSGSDLSVTQTIGLTVDAITNYFIAFDVVQKYPTLGTSFNKKIIYDVKAGKITAFITDSGAWINFLNGLLAFSKGDFNTAMNYFAVAAENDRSSLKKGCYVLASTCAIYSQNINDAVKFAELSGEKLYVDIAKIQYYTEHEEYDKAYPYVLEMESLLKDRADLSDYARSELYLALANMYVNPLFVHQDLQKAFTYISEAERLGSENAGYMVYVYYTMLEDERFVSAETAYRKLGESAAAGYPPAFYMWAYNLELIGKTENAAMWYAKSADAGSRRGMANCGKIMIDMGDKEVGIKWLRKSLEGNELEAELNDMEATFGFRPMWPSSRYDVELLLKKTLNGTSPSSSSPTTSQSSSLPNSSSSAYSPTQSSNYSQSNSSSNISSQGNYYSQSDNSNSSYSQLSQSNHNSSYGSSHGSQSHHQFNGAKDTYNVGWSIGYVRKEWRYSAPGHKEGVNVLGYDKYTRGLQFGLRIDPHLGYGCALNTGIFYEYYHDKSDDMEIDGNKCHYTASEHSLYFPFHFKYSLNFSKWFQLAFYGGIGLDWGLKGKIYLKENGKTIDSFKMYDDELDRKSFNTSLEYGGSLRINHFQLDFTMSKGLRNMSGSDEYKVKMNKLFCLSATYCY